MRCTAAAVAFLLTVQAVMGAQSPEPTQYRFEVASVKLNLSGERSAQFSPPVGRTVRVTNATIRQVISQAYGVPTALARFTVTGGPEKVLSTRVDISAKIPDSVPTGVLSLQQMLKDLLADRFKLRVHRETRQGSVYALIQVGDGKLGPRLRRTDQDCARWVEEWRGNPNTPPLLGHDKQPLCRGADAPAGVLRLRNAAPVAVLIATIQGLVDRPIVDMTGLTGNFEWDLTLASTALNTQNAAASVIYRAIDEQLGLKLQPQAGPLEVLVIESVELPEPN
jgi:uncharacterized protein (TIGR03435 family)